MQPIDPELRSPSSKFRGAPFWAWNSELNPRRLRRQIDQFRIMGFGGFHIHSRTGLQTPYMGSAFMSAVRDCVETARDKGMLTWLYDEDRWPSGYGSGRVTRNPQHRLKYLLVTPRPYCGQITSTPNWSAALGGRLENGRLIARYAVHIDTSSYIRYRRLRGGEMASGSEVEWLAYMETVEGVPWFNNQGYVDTLSASAIRAFIESTHENYRSLVGKEFGKTIPAIFTDEPQHQHKQSLRSARDLRDIHLPITEDFFDSYRAEYDESLEDHLPELLWDLPPDQSSPTRYRYHNHVADRFAGAYAKQLALWCGENGLMLTGHMMEEASLESQSRAVGEVMRSLAHFQLPGIDMLCDDFEFTTAKQAQSIAHQYNRPGVLSELYGVTGWEFDFIGHKAQGDWQAAMGVTVRVPHLSWMTMKGEAKRDFPASIHYQSPWWREYHCIEDHFSRVNVILSKGKPDVRIAVLHPIESYWLCMGPLKETAPMREYLESSFQQLSLYLLQNQLDFNYLSECLLPEQNCTTDSALLKVGAMAYSAIIIPPCLTLRSTTLRILESFKAGGGMVVFYGEPAERLDAMPSDEIRQFSSRCNTVACLEESLVSILEGHRTLRIRDGQGQTVPELLYQLRSDSEQKHLFICNRNRIKGHPKVIVSIPGKWKAIRHDTRTGNSEAIASIQSEFDCKLHLDLPAHGHQLLSLIPGHCSAKYDPVKGFDTIGQLKGPVPISLSEPNALLLNQPEWRLNEGSWQTAEETLRIANRIRKHFDLLPREGHIIQPWADNSPSRPLGRLELRFSIDSLQCLCCPQLALEEAEQWQIRVNGKPVCSKPTAWWVDECIEVLDLPDLHPGKNRITLKREIDDKTDLEWMYLLGNFSVFLQGRHAQLGPPVKELKMGDWTQQGLPFYTGNVDYQFRLNSNQIASAQAIDFSNFRGSLLKLTAADIERSLAYAPFCFEPDAQPLPNEFKLTVFGHRHNAFGPLHNTCENLRWKGPDTWRTTGDEWSYNYHLHPMGLIQGPRLLHAKR